MILPIQEYAGLGRPSMCWPVAGAIHFLLIDDSTWRRRHRVLDRSRGSDSETERSIQIHHSLPLQMQSWLCGRNDVIFFHRWQHPVEPVRKGPPLHLSELAQCLGILEAQCSGLRRPPGHHKHPQCEECVLGIYPLALTATHCNAPN